MARYNPFKGRSVQSFLNADVSEFMGWNTRELRQAVRRLADVANKRQALLKKRDLISPATYEAGERKFSTAGKTENQLRAEFLRAKQFLENRTSTVTGAREFHKQAERELNKRRIQFKEAEKGVRKETIRGKTYNDMLRTYLDMRDKDPVIRQRTLKYYLLREAEIETDSEVSVEELAVQLDAEMSALFDVGGSQYGGVAEFFDFD